MEFLALTLAGILSTGAPLVLATLGETLTERAGVINLSLDGTILLAAMAAFALSFLSGNPWLGLGAGALVGVFTAALVAVLGPVLGRSQVAVGFILTLLATIFQITAIITLVPLTWQRYVIPAAPLTCLWAAYGVALPLKMIVATRTQHAIG